MLSNSIVASNFWHLFFCLVRDGLDALSLLAGCPLAFLLKLAAAAWFVQLCREHSNSPSHWLQRLRRAKSLVFGASKLPSHFGCIKCRQELGLATQGKMKMIMTRVTGWEKKN